jgi:hypothetical protein
MEKGAFVAGMTQQGPDVIASEAKQSRASQLAARDCFAALAMTNVDYRL